MKLKRSYITIFCINSIFNNFAADLSEEEQIKFAKLMSLAKEREIKEEEDFAKTLQDMTFKAIEEYIEQKKAGKMPLSSMYGSNREELRQVVWDSVEAILDYFSTDLSKLKTFSSYASGDLALEYLILKVLNSADFKIENINIVDIMYPQGTYKKNSKEFIEDKYTWPVYPKERVAENQKVVQFFRDQFLGSNLNVYSTMYAHSIDCLKNPKLKSDLLFMSHFQGGDPDPKYKDTTNLLKIRVEAFKEKFPLTKDLDFNYVSAVNTNNNSLIVMNLGMSVVPYIFDNNYPRDLIKAMQTISYEASIRLYRPEYLIDIEKFIKLKKTIQDTKNQINKMDDKNPNKQLLLKYLNKFINRLRKEKLHIIGSFGQKLKTSKNNVEIQKTKTDLDAYKKIKI